MTASIVVNLNVFADLTLTHGVRRKLLFESDLGNIPFKAQLQDAATTSM